MKTIRIGLLLLVGAVTLVLASCEKKPEDPVVSQFPSPYFFTGILDPVGIQIRSLPAHDADNQYASKARRLLVLDVSGDRYSWFHQEQRTEFERRAQVIEALPSDVPYIHATPVDHETLSSGLASLTRQALTAYNDRYPEGADLSPIIRVSYRSFDGKTDGSKGAILDLAESKMEVRYPSIIQLKELDRLRIANSPLLECYLKEAPSVSPQTFRVTLKLMDGRAFTAELTTDVMKDKD